MRAAPEIGHNASTTLGRQQCITLEDQPPPKKEIAFTRSFGGPVTELADLVAAVTRFASGAAVKLRSQGSKAGQLQVAVQEMLERGNMSPCAAL